MVAIVEENYGSRGCPATSKVSRYLAHAAEAAADEALQILHGANPARLGVLVCKFCSREVSTAEEASRLTHTHMEEVVAQNETKKKSRFWKWMVVGAVIVIIIFFLSASRP